MSFSGEKVAFTDKKPVVVNVGSKEDISAVTAQFKEDEKFFIFDMDETLFYSEELLKQMDKARLEIGSKIKGWSKKHWEETSTKYSSSTEGDYRGMSVSMEEYIDKIELVDDFTVFLKPEPQIIEALEKVPYKKVVFSNSCEKRVVKIMEAIGLSKFFDLYFVWASNEDFITKPKKEAYDYVQEKLGVTDPQNIFFFDNREINAQMAKVFGWNALNVNQNICEKIDEALEIFGRKV